MLGCNCDDWKNNIPKINSMLVLQQLHTGIVEIKIFNYCPYCGMILIFDEKEYNKYSKEEK
jgi:hypothetical protein